MLRYILTFIVFAASFGLTLKYLYICPTKTEIGVGILLGTILAVFLLIHFTHDPKKEWKHMCPKCSKLVN